MRRLSSAPARPLALTLPETHTVDLPPVGRPVFVPITLAGGTFSDLERSALAIEVESGREVPAFLSPKGRAVVVQADRPGAYRVLARVEDEETSALAETLLIVRAPVAPGPALALCPVPLRPLREAGALLWRAPEPPNGEERRLAGAEKAVRWDRSRRPNRERLLGPLFTSGTRASKIRPTGALLLLRQSPPT